MINANTSLSKPSSVASAIDSSLTKGAVVALMPAHLNTAAFLLRQGPYCVQLACILYTSLVSQFS